MHPRFEILEGVNSFVIAVKMMLHSGSTQCFFVIIDILSFEGWNMKDSMGLPWMTAVSIR